MDFKRAEKNLEHESVEETMPVSTPPPSPKEKRSNGAPLSKSRSPLLGASDSHNMQMQRHFYRPV